MTKTDYSYDIQKIYLEMFLSDAETFVRCQSIFEPINFDQKLKSAAGFIKDYAEKYKVMPEAKIVNAACKTQLEPITLPAEHYDWLMEEFENFSRHKSLERAIISSSDLLEEGNYGPVEKLIKDAIQISLNRDMGTDYWLDPKTRLTRLKESNGQTSTGWPNVDKRLYGGYKRGELNIWCAVSGGGKSLFLANQAVNFAISGLNVIYFTFELSEELVSMRIDSMVTGIPSKEVFKQMDDVELKVKMIGKKSGGIQIKYLPTGKNCNDLRSYIKEYRIRSGITPDILVVDYLDLMMPVGVKVDPSNLFIKDKYVSEELRNLAMETQTIVVSAAQFNRTGVDELEFDHSHISGGLSKIQTADNVFGIFTSRAMREQGRYQIQFMKTRSSSGVGQKVDLDFDVDTLKITDPDDEQEVEASMAIKRAQGVKPFDINSFKKTSTVVNSSRSNDPLDGSDIPRVKAVTGSSVRDLLRSLNTEKD
jgi:KaiC/GvpD/RAD55 family RecA-like ATPase